MRLILTLCMATLLAGCATNKPLTALPESTSEFSKSKEELVSKYPDIGAYEETWRGFSPNNPLVEDVVNRLGSPKRIERDWWYPIAMVGTLVALSADPIAWGIVLAVRPDTLKTYYFEKDRYCIVAIIDKTIVSRYEPYMTSWTWNDNKENCKN